MSILEEVHRALLPLFMATLLVKIDGLFQCIQFSKSDGDLSIETPNFIASIA